MSISSKRLRFEILKRDGFACRYCGVTAVASPLHIDHVIPKSKGGTDDAANLVTACRDCNLGKSATPLDESRIPSVTADDLRDQAETVTAYLDAQKALEAARDEVADWLVGLWQAEVDERGMPRSLARGLGAVASRHRLDDIATAILQDLDQHVGSQILEERQFIGGPDKVVPRVRKKLWPVGLSGRLSAHLPEHAVEIPGLVIAAPEPLRGAQPSSGSSRT